MSVSPCTYDVVNGELRTVPRFFSNGKVYNGFVRANNVDVGTEICPGIVLGALYWDDGTTTEVVVPPGCEGAIERFGELKEHRIHRRPSQVLLILRQ